jgi:hypothetical protein
MTALTQFISEQVEFLATMKEASQLSDPEMTELVSKHKAAMNNDLCVRPQSVIQDSPRKHPGSTQEAPRRHPGHREHFGWKVVDFCGYLQHLSNIDEKAHGIRSNSEEIILHCF